MEEGLFIDGNPYGFVVNIQHPKILPLYKRFKQWKGIPPHSPVDDSERLEFEGYILEKLGRKADCESGTLQ